MSRWERRPDLVIDSAISNDHPADPTGLTGQTPWTGLTPYIKNNHGQLSQITRDEHTLPSHLEHDFEEEKEREAVDEIQVEKGEFFEKVPQVEAETATAVEQVQSPVSPSRRHFENSRSDSQIRAAKLEESMAKIRAMKAGLQEIDNRRRASIESCQGLLDACGDAIAAWFKGLSGVALKRAIQEVCVGSKIHAYLDYLRTVFGLKSVPVLL
jgi:hypothetical protein